MYTVPASTTAVVTNIVAANPSSSAATVSATIDGIAVAKQLSVSGSSTAFIDLKQVVATTKKLSVLTSISQADVMISGMTVA